MQEGLAGDPEQAYLKGKGAGAEMFRRAGDRGRPPCEFPRRSASLKRAAEGTDQNVGAGTGGRKVRGERRVRVVYLRGGIEINVTCDVAWRCAGELHDGDQVAIYCYAQHISSPERATRSRLERGGEFHSIAVIFEPRVYAGVFAGR